MTNNGALRRGLLLQRSRSSARVRRCFSSRWPWFVRPCLRTAKPVNIKFYLRVAHVPGLKGVLEDDSALNLWWSSRQAPREERRPWLRSGSLTLNGEALFHPSGMFVNVQSPRSLIFSAFPRFGSWSSFFLLIGLGFAFFTGISRLSLLVFNMASYNSRLRSSSFQSG